MSRTSSFISCMEINTKRYFLSISCFSSNMFLGSLGTGSMCSVASANSRAHSLPKNKRDSFAISEDVPVRFDVSFMISRKCLLL